MRTVPRVFAALLFVASFPGQGQADHPLRVRLDDQHAAGADFWIYNDIPAALREAKRTGKPIFVTFRCVPCKACESFDAEVAKGSDLIEQMARDHFIAVRQVEMEGVDLNQFQFDFDLNWAAMFINADGTVYARYGTQSVQGPDAYNSIAGLKATMERVLKLHEAYPRNAAELKGKKPPVKPYRTAMEMPGLTDRQRFRAETSRKNCIHCHMIHDAENIQALNEGRSKESLFYRYPLPENIGLVIEADHGTRIARVQPGSPADKAGLRAGEEITHMNGQAMTSIADMQWVLHHLPSGKAVVRVTGTRSGEKTLRLKDGWKKHDFWWRGSMWSISPKLRTWLPSLDEQQRRNLRLNAGQGAFEVRWINTGSRSGKAVRKAGLRQKDVIVALDGRSLPVDTRQFQALIKTRYEVGDTLHLTVVRNGKRLKINVPLVE